MAKTIDMTQGKSMGLLIRFALPLMVGNLFQQLYSLVDRIIVGRYIGTSAFAAVGATASLSNMFMAMCMGAAIGTGVVVSQYLGAKDEKNVAASIANGIYVNVIIAVIMTILALVFARPLLILMNTPASLLEDATNYMRVYMGGLIAVAAYFAPFSILRALGDSKTPLIFLIVASVLNVGLDLLFVITFQMGVGGAALATILAQAIAAVMCLVYAFRKVPLFKLTLRNARFNKHIFLQTIKMSVPTGFQYSLVHLSGSALQWVINGFGEVSIAAFTATTQIETLIQQPFTALASAMVTYTGQNIGAGNMERVKLGMRASMKIAATYSLFMLAILWPSADYIMRMFVSDQSVIQMAATGLRITGLFLIALGMTWILRYLLNGAGDSMFAMVNGIVEIVGRIGLVMILTRITFIGVWGIWVTTGLTWTITMLFALWRYRSGAWMTKSLVGQTTDKAWQTQSALE